MSSSTTVNGFGITATGCECRGLGLKMRSYTTTSSAMYTGNWTGEPSMLLKRLLIVERRSEQKYLIFYSIDGSMFRTSLKISREDYSYQVNSAMLGSNKPSTKQSNLVEKFSVRLTHSARYILEQTIANPINMLKYYFKWKSYLKGGILYTINSSVANPLKKLPHCSDPFT